MKKNFLRFLPAAFTAGLFFAVVGAHWAALNQFGSDMPHWDQWDAEGLNLFAPWFEHDHFWAHLFQPHNEHRIVVTKLQNFALTLLAGQWDTRLECAANALIHAALAVAFWLAARRWIAARWQAPLFVALAALFAAPVAWQNVLGGFHSQQYWLLLFSFVAMVLLPFARTWSVRWWMGALAAALALLTQASGFFAALVVFGVVAFRWWRRETSRREIWPTLALTLALIAAGWLTRVEVTGHEPLKAKTAHDFFLYLARSLQWPAPRDDTWLAAVLWLPWLVVVWLVASKRSEGGHALREKSASPAGLAIAALGGWTFAQIVATAYARGANADYPAPRYVDTLKFGMAVNALATAWLLSEFKLQEGRFKNGQLDRNARPGRFFLLPSRILSLAWLGVFAWGLYDATHITLAHDMPEARSFYREAEAHMRGYLMTNDPAQLSFNEIPYPDRDALIDRLRHASLRAILPVSIRPPLPMKPAAPSTVFFENHASQIHPDVAPHHGISPNTGVLTSHPTWGSFGASGAAATGEWTSAPLSASLGGWLKFETAGDLGREGVALELRDAQTHALLAEVRPTKVPGEGWRAAYVRAPRGPFVVVARDASPERWLAFSGPVEMSSLSYFAWQTVKNGWLVFELTVSLSALLGLGAVLARRSGAAAG